MGKLGRPTKYKPEFCKELLDFFNIPHTKTNSEGKEVANQLPLFEKFAFKIGVNYDTLLEWLRTDEEGKPYHPEWVEAYKQAKNLQKSMGNDLALRGLHNATYAIFFAKNCLDMKDQTQIENSGNLTITINRKIDDGDIASE